MEPTAVRAPFWRVWRERRGGSVLPLRRRKTAGRREGRLRRSLRRRKPPRFEAL